MSPKHDFLFGLAVRLEAAEIKAASNPQDTNASIYAQSLRELHVSLSAYPEDHTFFQQWARQPWEPVALSDQASAKDFEHADLPRPIGPEPHREMPARHSDDLKAAFLGSYCA